MKLYPTTNTILDGNDVQAETLNAEVRECFEVANGGIDQYNIERGTNVCGGAGLSSLKFADNAWNQVFTAGGGELGLNGDIFTIREKSTSVAQHRFATNNHTNIKAGVVSGVLQIRYWMNSLALSNEAKIDYDRAAFEVDPTCDFSIYANGAKVGETDTVSKTTHGTVTIPFYFYHPGGNIRIDLYCNANGGEPEVDLTSHYPNLEYPNLVPYNFRFRVQNYHYFANVRVR